MKNMIGSLSFIYKSTMDFGDQGKTLVIYFLFLFILSPHNSFPQLKDHPISDNIRITRISTEDGLSQSSVEAIYRDSRGFMWFGTEEGLNKYDGYKFTIYKSNRKDSTSLNNEVINSILEDESGTMWIGTRVGGLNKFNREKETFKAFVNDPKNPNSISDDKINTLFKSTSFPGVLWIGTESGGLNRFDIKKESFTHIKFDPGKSGKCISADRVMTIFESKAEPGILWIGTSGGGLNRYDVNSGTFQYFKHNSSNPNSLSSNDIWKIYEMPDKPGILWIGTRSGLNSFDIKRNSFIRFKNDPLNNNSISNDDVTSISSSVIEPGILWVGTHGGGMNRIVLSENETINKGQLAIANIQRFQTETGNDQSLSSNDIYSIYENSSQPGIMWVGTFDGGVNKIYKSQKKFTHYKNKLNEPNSLIDNLVWGIFEDKNKTIWVGTHNGLSSISRDALGIASYKNYTTSGSPNVRLSSNVVQSFLEPINNTGFIWAGTWGGGLNKLLLSKDSRTIEKIVHYKHDPNNLNSLSWNHAVTLYESKDEPDILWVGTYRGGLNRFDTKSNTFKHYKNDPDNPNSISSNNLFFLYGSKSDSNIIWIGTLGGGLNKFDKSKETFKTYSSDEKNEFSISSDIVLSIYQSKDEPNILWVGTAEGGLNKFNIKKEKFYHYTIDDGLPNNIINGIEEDENGNLWISTNKGISVFNPTLNTFRNYDVHDGLQSNEFNGKACFKSSTGEIFFGGMNGVTAFHPANILDNPNIPPIVITDFKIFNKSVFVKKDSKSQETKQSTDYFLEKSITETKEIILSYDQNFFSFEFAALDYATPNKNQYAYKMEGFDDEWILSGNRRYAGYTNLDPGEYVFHVKGSNNDGVWNESGSSIIIIITPPFYKTWWFLIIFWIIVSIIVLATVRHFATKKLKKQIEKLERERELEKERIRISRDMHDEVGTNLTEIAILSELVKKDVYKPDDAILHLNSISGQIAEIIDNIGQIIWAINPKNDPLENLISYIRKYSKNFLDKAGIKSKFDITDNISDINLSAEVRRNIFLIIKESLNNTVKHAEATEVNFDMKLIDSKFVIKISDNGKGFTQAREFGNGLTNMKKRAAEIKGEYKISSEPNEGTTVDLMVLLKE